MEFESFTLNYFEKLSNAIKKIPLPLVEQLKNSILRAWKEKNQLFIFGNGGSAGNAIHLANDYIYGIGKGKYPGLKVHALTANPSVLTCLANDVGYENIFTEQLKALSNKNDIALAFSGSGNSANVVEALRWCEVNGMETYAILGYSGGKAAKIAKNAIHIAVDDMQISEDLQLIIGHIIMQWIAEYEELKSQ